jgi:hypothetical protein
MNIGQTKLNVLTIPQWDHLIKKDPQLKRIKKNELYECNPLIVPHTFSFVIMRVKKPLK